MPKTAGATATNALVHSVSASDDTKRQARSLMGTRAYDVLYRTHYNTEATLGLVAPAAYIRRLPGVELYHAKRAAALALRAGQLAGLACTGWAERQVGPLRFSGQDGLVPYALGKPEIPPSPVGQGFSVLDLGPLPEA